MSESEKQKKRISKFLSLILRHKPEAIGVELDAAGWINIETLLDAMLQNGTEVTREQLNDIVVTNTKQRFVISDCGQRIRANQGHSVEIELGYSSKQPPEYLFHGAAKHNLNSILKEGLKKMQRHAVHLNAAPGPCKQVASRHGKPTILRIKSGEMHRQDFHFYQSPNDVWLVDHVPPQFIDEEAKWRPDVD